MFFVPSQNLRNLIHYGTKKESKPLLERDISWMFFNRRILQEATRPHVPLLERMSF